jgi:FAD:protein FMN transferase
VRLRRAQPWLGTMVEIEVSHRSRNVLLQATDQAFAAIARVHRLMSRQLADSDVARLNHAPAGRRVPVHAWTARTLSQALHWQRLSASAFDIVEPGRGSRRGPAAPLRVLNDRTGAGATVLKQRNCRISLDGIAKGFAIDQAIRVLRRHQVHSGLVIAGGDLRCFGARTFRVSLRRPDAAAPAPAWQLRVRDCAMATSGRYFGGTLWNTASDDARASWTVMARTATAADALTKVVYGLAADSAKLLRQCAARAWYVQPCNHSFVCVEL